MPRISNMPLPDVVKMPLREALRGISSVAGQAEEVLSPFKTILPDPVRGALGDMLHSLESGSAALVGAHVTEEAIVAAAAFLRGEADAKSDAAACAEVLAFAWDKVRHEDASRPILSEALTATCLATIGDDTLPPSDHAARILLALRQAHVTGMLPGLPIHHSDEDREGMDLHLMGLAVWLMADRAETMADELQLLKLSMALTLAFREDVLKAMATPQALSALLTTLADHL